MRLVGLALLATLVLALPALPVRAQTALDSKLKPIERLIEEQKFDEAIGALQDLQNGADEADQPRIANAMGWVYFSAGMTDKARTQLEAAYADAGRQGNLEVRTKAANNLGILFFGQGDMESARKYFEETKQNGSKLADKYLPLIDRQERLIEANENVKKGVTLRQSGKFDQAVGDYTAALKLAPEDPRTLEYRGYAQFRLGQLDGALADLKRSYELDPKRLNTVINLLKVHCKRQDMAAAAAISKDAAQVLRAHRSAVLGDTELKRVCGDQLANLIPN